MFKSILMDKCVNTNFKSIFILSWFRLCQLIVKNKMLIVLFFPILLFYRIVVEWFMGCELNWSIKSGRIKLYHGQGLVINPKTIFGNDCILRCNTVFGNKSGSGAPVVGDRVNFGANCCIIGGIKIGDDVTVGAGSVVVKDVPPGVTVAGNPAKILSE
ncbi:serine acetyltransferase [Vibrio owensii]|uniref:serine acetyltransferase n=1 Tax=Vibrio owensii TaxID=696485 RepID=UPI00391FC78D